MIGHHAPPGDAFAATLPMSSAYFALILRGFGTDTRTRRALLAGTGIEPDGLATPPREIALGQQLQQVRNANRLLEPGWALAIGARLHPATHGPIGVAAVSAPTVGDALTVMTRFSAVRAPHFRLRRHAAGDEVRLVPEDRVTLGRDERRALLDIVLQSTQHLVAAVIGRPPTEARFELTQSMPDEARRYRDAFSGPVRFGCKETAIVLPAAWLTLPCPLADPALFAAAWRTLTAGERRLAGAPFAPASVEMLLTTHGPALALPAAARALHTSRRTLARRLRAEGTSYRRLLDDAQRQHAAALLTDPHLTIGEIATALGYEDASNFGRAARRWFGMSAGAYRRAHRASVTAPLRTPRTN